MFVTTGSIVAFFLNFAVVFAEQKQLAKQQDAQDLKPAPSPQHGFLGTVFTSENLDDLPRLSSSEISSSLLDWKSANYEKWPWNQLPLANAGRLDDEELKHKKLAKSTMQPLQRSRSEAGQTNPSRKTRLTYDNNRTPRPSTVKADVLDAFEKWLFSDGRHVRVRETVLKLLDEMDGSVMYLTLIQQLPQSSRVVPLHPFKSSPPPTASSRRKKATTTSTTTTTTEASTPSSTTKSLPRTTPKRTVHSQSELSMVHSHEEVNNGVVYRPDYSYHLGQGYYRRSRRRRLPNRGERQIFSDDKK